MDDPPLPTIEDYLNLVGISLDLKYSLGQHGEFFWMASCDYIEDFSRCISMPSGSYCIVMTDFDGDAAASYGKDPGWSAVGTVAVSEMMTGLPDINYHADTAMMIFESKPSASELLRHFDGVYFSDLEIGSDPFWTVLEDLKPYCFASYLGDLFFCSLNKEHVEAMYSPTVLAQAELFQVDWIRANRAALWQDLGPECGPETCIEAGCSRLRIRLAVRSFLHQLWLPNRRTPDEIG